jgi:hypothetical protein
MNLWLILFIWIVELNKIGSPEKSNSLANGTKENKNEQQKKGERQEEGLISPR